MNDINEALTGMDIYNCLNGRCTILNYNKLTEYNNIEDIFNGNEIIILLYESKKNYGHWVAILDRGKSIEHFDAYGIMPDEELKYSSYNFRKYNNMLLPHLTYLLYISPKKIEYNNYQLQQYKRGINTCGKWAVIRSLARNININDFSKIFLNQNKYSTDMAISIIYKKLFNL